MLCVCVCVCVCVCLCGDILHASCPARGALKEDDLHIQKMKFFPSYISIHLCIQTFIPLVGKGVYYININIYKKIYIIFGFQYLLAPAFLTEAWRCTCLLDGKRSCFFSL